MVINYNFVNLSLDKKEEIRDIAISLSNIVNNYFCFHKYKKFDIEDRLYRAYALYKEYYKDRLTNEEKSVFYLYALIPNDDYFMKLINKYNKNYEELAKLFSVKPKIIKLRYILQNNIRIERDLENANSKKKTIN